MIRRFKINHESPAKSRNSQITACGIGELVIILSSYNHHKARSPVTARINLFLQGTGGLNIEEIGEKLLTQLSELKKCSIFSTNYKTRY